MEAGNWKLEIPIPEIETGKSKRERRKLEWDCQISNLKSQKLETRKPKLGA
jgi:hypothetical protein